MTRQSLPPSARAGNGRMWAYLGLLLGGGASIAANVAHSFVPPTSVVAELGEAASSQWSPQPGAVVTAVIWPVFLFIAIEILSKPAWPAGLGWTVLRFGGLTPVATVAAIVSYRHLSGLLRYYAEDSLTCAIGPLAVDGLMVMASGALVAISRRVVDRTEAIAESLPIEPAPSVPTELNTVTPASVPLPIEVDSDPVLIDGTEGEAQVRPESEHAQPAPESTSTRPRPRSGNAEIVRRAAESNPQASIADLVAMTNLSRATVRRYRPATSDLGTPEPINGHEPLAEPAEI